MAGSPKSEKAGKLTVSGQDIDANLTAGFRCSLLLRLATNLKNEPRSGVISRRRPSKANFRRPHKRGTYHFH